MPHCQECDSPISRGAKFCPECGTSFKSKSNTAAGQTGSDAKTRKRAGGPIYGLLNLEDLPSGHIIDDRYEIKEKLGQGGFGAVYRAYDKNMEVDKALKVLPEAMASDREAMLDLRSEAKAMVVLNHPTIVRVYDFHDTGTIKYIDMEYVAGKTLTDIKLEYPDKRVPEDMVKELGLQIAKGLAYAHEKGIIHKDIKPQNIMVTTDGQVKIMDFGIAETVRTSMSRVEQSSSSGTLVYMSPEQLRGKDVGKEADIYSFGAVLYELLSGHPPFYKGDIQYQILNEKAEQIAGVSAELNRMLLKCLEKEYKERYRTIGEIIQGFSDLLCMPSVTREPTSQPSRAKKKNETYATSKAVKTNLAAIKSKYVQQLKTKQESILNENALNEELNNLLKEKNHEFLTVGLAPIVKTIQDFFNETGITVEWAPYRFDDLMGAFIPGTETGIRIYTADYIRVGTKRNKGKIFFFNEVFDKERYSGLLYMTKEDMLKSLVLPVIVIYTSKNTTQDGSEYDFIWETGYDSERIAQGIISLLAGKSIRSDFKCEYLSHPDGKISKEGMCFIATAVFGSHMAPEVLTLQSFRDLVLVRYRIGRKFVDYYQRVSPSLVGVVQNSPIIAICLRALLKSASSMISSIMKLKKTQQLPQKTL